MNKMQSCYDGLMASWFLIYADSFDEVVAVVVRGGEEEVEALAGVGLHGAEVQIALGGILGT